MTVSSAESAANAGSLAVDGDSVSYLSRWKSADDFAVVKWIAVDYGLAGLREFFGEWLVHRSLAVDALDGNTDLPRVVIRADRATFGDEFQVGIRYPLHLEKVEVVTSAAEAAIETKLLIAALKRCATQNPSRTKALLREKAQFNKKQSL